MTNILCFNCSTKFDRLAKVLHVEVDTLALLGGGKRSQNFSVFGRSEETRKTRKSRKTLQDMKTSSSLPAFEFRVRVRIV